MISGVMRNKPRKMLHALFKRIIDLGIFHVADVMAEKRVAITCQAECILQLAADGQCRFDIERKLDRIGSIAAASAQINRTIDFSGSTSDHRIITADVNVSVVQQECICQRGQPFERILVVGGNRLLGEISAGHHQHRRDRFRGQTWDRSG